VRYLHETNDVRVEHVMFIRNISSLCEAQHVYPSRVTFKWNTSCLSVTYRLCVEHNMFIRHVSPLSGAHHVYP
jgi:hypothetical protein